MADTLFTRTQSKVLGLLFGRPERSFFANEIVRAAGKGVGAVQRELSRLVASGLVVSKRVGNQRHFQANRDAPIFQELTGIFGKLGQTGPAVAEDQGDYIVAGSLRVSRESLSAIASRFHIRRLSVFGPALRSELNPEEAVDVLVDFKPGREPGMMGLLQLRQQLSGSLGYRRFHIATREVLKNPHRRSTIESGALVLHAA
jgi:predicted nucleotidyltransferase